MIKANKDGVKVELTVSEIEFLGKLYQDIKDKKQSFEEYIEQYKKDQIDKFIGGK